MASHQGARIPEETRAQIVKRLKTPGYSVDAIARRYGVCTHTVRNIGKAAHVPSRREGPTIAQVVDLFEEGLSIAAIGRKLKSSRTTIYKKLDDAGYDKASNTAGYRLSKVLPQIRAGEKVSLPTRFGPAILKQLSQSQEFLGSIDFRVTAGVLTIEKIKINNESSSKE